MSLYLANSLLTASRCLELSRYGMMKCANTFPSGGTSLVILETYMCCSHAILAKLVIFTRIMHIFHVLSVRGLALTWNLLDVKWRQAHPYARTYWMLNGDRPMNTLELIGC